MPIDPNHIIDASVFGIPTTHRESRLAQAMSNGHIGATPTMLSSNHLDRPDEADGLKLEGGVENKLCSQPVGAPGSARRFAEQAGKSLIHAGMGHARQAVPGRARPGFRSRRRRMCSRPRFCSGLSTSVTLARRTPSMIARSSCVRGTTFEPTRSRVISSHRQQRISTVCRPLQATA